MINKLTPSVACTLLYFDQANQDLIKDQKFLSLQIRENVNKNFGTSIIQLNLRPRVRVQGCLPPHNFKNTLDYPHENFKTLHFTPLNTKKARKVPSKPLIAISLSSCLDSFYYFQFIYLYF